MIPHPAADEGVEILPPESAAHLIAFARACRAASRAIALYPTEHPAVGTTLAHLVSAADQATAAGEVRLSVFPDGLTIGEQRLPKPDLAASELALWLHERQVGELTIRHHTSASAWRQFLSVVALPPDQARRRGGISRLWASEGHSGIALRQVDYGHLLLARIDGDRATWRTILDRCLEGDAECCDDWMLSLVMEVLAKPTEVGQLVTAVKTRTDGAPERTAAMIVGLLRAVAEFVGETQPDHLDPLMDAMADAASQLSTEALAAAAAYVKAGRRSDQHAFLDQLSQRMTNDALAGHVASAIRDGDGTSPKIQDFLSGFVSQIDRRSSVLALAQTILEQAGGGEVPPALQQQIDFMLLGYDDKPFVSDAYAGELQHAASRAIDLDRDTTDPPDRIASWTATLADDRIRMMDAHLLVDLLHLRPDLAEWRDLARLAVVRINVLLVVGDLGAAAFLVEALRLHQEDHPNPDIRAAAAATVEELLNPDVVRHLAMHLDTSDSTVLTDARRICTAVGPAIVPHLAEVLSHEERTRTREHLMGLLTAFGSAGRASVERLMQSPSAAVRRTAILLMREFGGIGALPKLEAMLMDEEPRVQREAIRAIALLATDQAYDTLVRALMARGTSAAGVGNVLWSLPTDETAPLLISIVTQAPQGGAMRDVQERAIQRLGHASGREAIEALAEVMQRGDWYAPFRTAQFRRLAADALRRIGTPDALDTLRGLAVGGTWGMRHAALAAMAQIREHPPRQSGGPR